MTTAWLLYVAITIPFIVGFNIEPKGTLYIIERIVDIHFISDVLINFRTGEIPLVGRFTTQATFQREKWSK